MMVGPTSIWPYDTLPLFFTHVIYYHYYEHGGEHQVPRHEGVRNARYKLINFYSDDGYNLFDLEEDPDEMQDVSNDPRYAKVMKTMTTELKRLRQHYDLPPLNSAAR